MGESLNPTQRAHFFFFYLLPLLLFFLFLSLGIRRKWSRGVNSWKRVAGRKGKKSEEVGKNLYLSSLFQSPLIQGKKAEVTRSYVFQLLLGCYFQFGPTSDWHRAIMAQDQHIVGLLAHVKNLTFQLSNGSNFQSLCGISTYLHFKKCSVHCIFTTHNKEIVIVILCNYFPWEKNLRIALLVHT